MKFSLALPDTYTLRWFHVRWLSETWSGAAWLGEAGLSMAVRDKGSIEERAAITALMEFRYMLVCACHETARLGAASRIPAWQDKARDSIRGAIAPRSKARLHPAVRGWSLHGFARQG